ncbi:DnaJ family domain-containing protein [Paenibacillus faecalis]|uniref:DnaJ family domain-containing protein n=1 Tax=Paenibacillus faecalis TaxID=2079532 RepID=UPI000D111E84|nr:DnaJ family domain-containing protein [Paenibacillus faecalis]
MELNDNRKESMSSSEENHKKDNEERQMSTSNSLVESAVGEFARKGGFDDLRAKGKPIKIEDGDVLTGIMKNANYQPAWIELRKEIAAEIKRLLECADLNSIPEEELEGINQKIMKYNRIVPNQLLQKGLVSKINLHTAYEKWE